MGDPSNHWGGIENQPYYQKIKGDYREYYDIDLDLVKEHVQFMLGEEFNIQSEIEEYKQMLKGDFFEVDQLG